MARDLWHCGRASVLFSMLGVMFASGYQVVYQALAAPLVRLLSSYAFLNVCRQGLGEIPIPVDLPDEVPASWHAEVLASYAAAKPEKDFQERKKDTKSKKKERQGSAMTLHVHSEVGQLKQ